MENNFEVSEITENLENGLEVVADVASDFLNSEGIEALEAGDFNGALENSDFGKESAELVKFGIEEFGVNLKDTFGGKLAAISTTTFATTLPSPEPISTGASLVGMAIGLSLAKLGI